MQNIKISHEFSGLEGLVKAIDNLAGAIKAQEAFVVPTEQAATVNTSEPKEANVTPKDSPAPTQEAPKSTVSLDVVREKFVELARKGKRQELKDLLSEFNADNVSSLPETVWDEVYSRLEAM